MNSVLINSNAKESIPELENINIKEIYLRYITIEETKHVEINLFKKIKHPLFANHFAGALKIVKEDDPRPFYIVSRNIFVISNKEKAKHIIKLSNDYEVINDEIAFKNYNEKIKKISVASKKSSKSFSNNELLDFDRKKIIEYNKKVINFYKIKNSDLSKNLLENIKYIKLRSEMSILILKETIYATFFRDFRKNKII